MADSDFEFDEILGEAKETLRGPEGTTGNTDATSTTGAAGTTRTTGTTSHTGRTQHPFSVRLDQEHVELIQALAWWKRISQRAFIEQLLDDYVQGSNSKDMQDIIKQYRQHH